MMSLFKILSNKNFETTNPIYSPGANGINPLRKPSQIAADPRTFLIATFPP